MSTHAVFTVNEVYCTLEYSKKVVLMFSHHTIAFKQEIIPAEKYTILPDRTMHRISYYHFVELPEAVLVHVHCNLILLLPNLILPQVPNSTKLDIT